MPVEVASFARFDGNDGQGRAVPMEGSAGPANPVDPREWDWSDLYSRLGRGLVSLGRRRYALALEDAEEALQRAATAIVFAAPSVRNPEAYLTAVFLRECSAVRKQRQETARREPQLADGVEPADDSHTRIEIVCHFRKAFSLLSPFCQSVMRSCLIEGKARTLAATEIQASEKTIYKRYRKCLRTLAHALA